MIKEAVKFARSVLQLCARVVHWGRKPTDDEIRVICTRLLTASDLDFESVVRELQRALWRRLHTKGDLTSFRYVLRPQQRQSTNLPDTGPLSKQRDKSAIVDNIARNERQKMSLLVEHRHILDDIYKELMEDNRDLVERTKKLIEESKKSIAKRKSA